MQCRTSGTENPGQDAHDILGRLLTLPSLRFSVLRQSPAVDMIDEGRSMHILVDLPGVNESEIQVHVGTYSISVLTSEDTDTGRKYYYRERAVAEYYKSIPMPAEVDAQSVRFHLSNGTLDITVDKRFHKSSHIQ